MVPSRNGKSMGREGVTETAGNSWWVYCREAGRRRKSFRGGRREEAVCLTKVVRGGKGIGESELVGRGEHGLAKQLAGNVGNFQ